VLSRHKRQTQLSRRNLREMTKASLQNARHRLKTFPKIAASCSVEAIAYGKCVTGKHDDITHNSCLKEFQLFRQCLQSAAEKMKVRI